ncbi:YigZ family protein [Mycobacterium sp. ACS4331]|uniref:IMPACT family protein n=1 Tax=Mycobacterium sp. ACS4331 TaxID=1834121 RepID=UPI0008007E31|nr:YigZ family protein [Mycobacterium sp. ACS4331]OBF13625.1 IMPACT family protein [Mycobacterium sp. ACS4331]
MPFTLPRGASPVAEEIIKRSRFTAHVRHVESEQSFGDFLAEVREVDRAAGHHCRAFIIGDDARVERSNDDGEPGGTAGAPILAALKSRDLTNVAAVVSRHYGGVNLGTGGLARAYSGVVLAALEGQPLRPRIRAELFELSIDHAKAGRVEAELRGRGFEVVDAEYGPQAVFTVASTEADALRAAVAGLTAGGAELVPAGHLWR